MTQRVTVYLDDDAAGLLVQLAGSSRKQGEYLSGLLRTVAAGADGTVRREAFQVAAELNLLTNRLMELAGQPTRFIATRTAGAVEPASPDKL